MDFCWKKKSGLELLKRGFEYETILITELLWAMMCEVESDSRFRDGGGEA